MARLGDGVWRHVAIEPVAPEEAALVDSFERHGGTYHASGRL